MAIVKAFRILLIVGGVLALAGVSLVFSSFGSSSSSTTSIPPGPNWYMYYEFNVLGRGNLRGDYQETTGGDLDLYVLTAAQYASYRAGTNIGSLWALGSSRAGTIDVELPGSGKYFLVADHGTTYEQVQQVVRLSIHLTGIDPTIFPVGVAIFTAGFVISTFGVLRWRMFASRKSLLLPPPSA
jgi:hypothetical protein